MFEDERKVYSRVNNEKPKTFFLPHINSKYINDSTRLVQKNPQDETNYNSQYFQNNIGIQKIDEKRSTFDHSLNKKKDDNKDAEMRENIEENNINKDEPEVKYIIINNKNINLGMSTKLQNKINKNKFFKKNLKKQKIKFKTKQKIINQKNINFLNKKIINLDEELENEDEKNDKELELKLNANNLNNTNINTKVSNENKNEQIKNSSIKNRFIVHQNCEKDTKMELGNNSSFNNTYQKKIIESNNINCFDNIHKPKENEVSNANFNIEKNLNFNYESTKLLREQKELRNFPQIFESQNPSITISGIEYTTLLIPRMCVEKLKTILFG